MGFQQNGYKFIPESIAYDSWRNYCLHWGVNVDFAYGNQCWDVCALLWYQYGLRLQTGNGMAYGCWILMRNQNARNPFVQITRKEDIRRGDCVVFNRVGSYSTGHIAFADQNYNGTNSLLCLGQNQGQGIGIGATSNIAPMNLANFLGAFRNTKWKQAPEPEPEPPAPAIIKTKRFPWVLYSNKFRNRR